MSTRRPRSDPAAFARAIGAWRRAAPLDVVPVIGAGVNLQAARETAGVKAVDWGGLLEVVRQQLEFALPRSLPASFIQQWEAIVRYAAGDGSDRSASDVERAMQRVVATVLRDGEAEGAGALHQRIACAGFRDIVSLNFDRHLAIRAGPSRVVAAPRERRKVDEQTLWRHSQVGTTDRPTRIWYPHGDVRKPGSIKLGVRRYGLGVKPLDDLLRERWSQRRRADDDSVTFEPAEPAWLDAFLDRPLVFVGCSLSTDEWPLWWALHQRARNHVRKPANERPATFLLTQGAEPAHLVGRPADVQAIVFRTWPELWAAFGELLALVERSGRAG